MLSIVQCDVHAKAGIDYCQVTLSGSFCCCLMDTILVCNICTFIFRLPIDCCVNVLETMEKYVRVPCGLMTVQKLDGWMDPSPMTDTVLIV